MRFYAVGLSVKSNSIGEHNILCNTLSCKLREKLKFYVHQITKMRAGDKEKSVDLMWMDGVTPPSLLRIS